MPGQKITHQQKITVCCGFWFRSVIGPYFFENAHGDAVTENGERYGEMINTYFSHQSQNTIFCDNNDDVDMVDLWLRVQQDCVTQFEKQSSCYRQSFLAISPLVS